MTDYRDVNRPETRVENRTYPAEESGGRGLLWILAAAVLIGFAAMFFMSSGSSVDPGVTGAGEEIIVPVDPAAVPNESPAMAPAETAPAAPAATDTAPAATDTAPAATDAAPVAPEVAPAE